MQRTKYTRILPPLRKGFTIVELLIVIVVIGILAAITIVAFNGVQEKAVVTSLTSGLENASKILKLDQVTNDAFPTTLSAANGNKGVPASPGVVYQYIYSNSTPQTFCVTATKDNKSYNIDNEGIPLAGSCPVARYEIGSALSYPGTGTVLTDISGNGRHGTLVNGTGYSSNNGGALTFDGVNDYVQTPITIPTGRALTVDLVGSVANTTVSHNFVSANAPLFIRVVNGKIRWNLNVRKDSDAVSSWFFNDGNMPVVANTKYHLAMTYDGVSIKGYINGVKDIDIAVAGQIVPGQTIKIGYTTGGEDAPLAGSVSMMRVYNQALSDADVLQNYGVLRGKYNF